MALADQQQQKLLSPPPTFLPSQREEIASFFAKNGFVLLSDCLSTSELRELNDFYDVSQHYDPAIWGVDGPMKIRSYAQPLLDWPELDHFALHPNTFPVV